MGKTKERHPDYEKWKGHTVGADEAKALEELAFLSEVVLGDTRRSASYRAIAYKCRAGNYDIQTITGNGGSIEWSLCDLAGGSEPKRKGELLEDPALPSGVALGLCGIAQAVRGIGGKKARKLYDDHGAVDLATALELAKEKGALGKSLGDPLRTFAREEAGEKTPKPEGKKTRIPRERALALTAGLVAFLRAGKGVTDVSICGSLRRGLPDAKDVDLTMCVEDGAWATRIAALVRKGPLELGGVLVSIDGEHADRLNFVCEDEEGSIRVDCWFGPVESYGALVLYATGCKDFNIRQRAIAKGAGYLLNQTGLWDKKSERVAGYTEQEVFDAVGMSYVEPEDRI